MAAVCSRKSVIGGQRSVGSGRQADARGRKTDVRGQGTEGGGWRPASVFRMELLRRQFIALRQPPFGDVKEPAALGDRLDRGEE